LIPQRHFAGFGLIWKVRGETKHLYLRQSGDDGLVDGVDQQPKAARFDGRVVDGGWKQNAGWNSNHGPLLTTPIAKKVAPLMDGAARTRHHPRSPDWGCSGQRRVPRIGPGMEGQVFSMSGSTRR